MKQRRRYREVLKDRLARRRATSTDTGCWLYTGALTGNGYGHMSYYGRAEYTHRVAAVVFLDFDLSSGLCVRHECDTPACFNPSHLKVGTQEENMRDAAVKGRMGGGKKLTAAQAGEIKYLLGEGSSQRELATLYGVSTTAIGQISRGETWKAVEAAKLTT